MQIKNVLIKVENQQTALEFYTSVVGFIPKHDFSIGEFRWLTVTSPDDVHGVELVLETNAIAPGRAVQKIFFDSGFPALLLTTDDIEADHKRLTGCGVVFRSSPQRVGPVKTAFFEDSCGNVVGLMETIR